MIKPYLKSMTNSELMASMTGSFACIAGGVMATYIALGVPAEYLLAASIMAAPGALVISHSIMYKLHHFAIGMKIPIFFPVFG